MRSADTDVVFKTPIIREFLQAALELYRWHRYRASSTKLVSQMTNTAAYQNHIKLSGAGAGASASAGGLQSRMRLLSKSVTGEVDATDAAMDELSDFDVAFNQDSDNDAAGRTDGAVGDHDDNQVQYMAYGQYITRT